MFDPVTSAARRNHFRRKRKAELDEIKQGHSPNRCSLCGRKESKLYNGRCITCATKIVQAIHHHQLPPSKYKVKPIKKRIDDK
ncbi:MAG: hypothetical protein JSV49_09385 [Thermoplasmata archaeon]|nr:MAG: hypothetical protein JSV49_09385 [Thermoplasmata archaeon]